MLNIFPSDQLKVEVDKLLHVKRIVESTLRLITFSRTQLADNMLNAYLDKTSKLKDLLSIKNAQMEAESETEVRQYTQNLRVSMDFITSRILSHENFNSALHLFELFRLISPDAHARHANNFRHQHVQIGRYMCPDPEKISGLVSDLFFNMKKIGNPIIKAIYFHHELIRIHPFVDGNGRTTRMAKNWMLMYELYPPIFISNPEEKKRYVGVLEESFLQLTKQPSCWNETLASFFDQELDRLIRNALDVHDYVLSIGNKRKA